MLLLLPALASTLSGADFFVSPQGLATAAGSAQDPWDVATALAHPASVKPGDRIWLEAGTYPLGATLVSTLAGSARRPIIVRAKPGERVTLDCAPALAASPGSDCLQIKSVHAWYWGLEIANSSSERFSPTPGANPSLRGIGVNSLGGLGTKLINLVIHDVGTSIFESQPSGLEIYGLIAYNSGWDGPDRSHGPGIYVRNRAAWPTKTIRDSIVFQHYRQGLQGFGSFDNVFSNFVVEGNAFFNNGIGADGFHRNLMFGNSNSEHLNNVFRDNYTYYPGDSGPGSNMFGGDGGCAGLEVSGNVFAHGASRLALKLNDCLNAEISGNLFHGATNARVGGVEQTSEQFRAQYPQNEFYSDTLGAPTGTRVFVRPNRFEGGRAHIIIYNWDGLAAVDVDVSPLGLTAGTVEIRSAQNYYAPPLESPVVNGSLSIAMSGWLPALPIGYPQTELPATLPEFGVFILEWQVPRSTPYGARR